MFLDGAGLALAADHAEEREVARDPMAEDEGVVAMAAGDDEAEGAGGDERFGERFFPVADAEGDAGEDFLIGERGAVVEDSDGEIEREGHGGDGLRDVSGPGNPESAGRSDGFAVASCGGGIGPVDFEIVRDAPRHGVLAAGQFGPDRRGGMDAGEDDAADASAADKAVVPAKIVVENEVEGFRLTGDERLPGAVLDFGFEAAAAHGSCDASVGVEEGLGADFLRAGAFDVRDDAEGYGFVGRRGCCEDFVERGHDLSLADGRRKE